LFFSTLRSGHVTRPAPDIVGGRKANVSPDPPYIGGTIPSRPTEIEAASSVPSSFFAAPAMKIFFP